MPRCPMCESEIASYLLYGDSGYRVDIFKTGLTHVPWKLVVTKGSEKIDLLLHTKDIEQIGLNLHPFLEDQGLM